MALKPDAGKRFFGKFIGKSVRGVSGGVKLVKAPPDFNTNDRRNTFLMGLEAYQRALQTGDKRRIRGIRSAGVIVHAEKVSAKWRGLQQLEDKTIQDLDHLARIAYDSLVDSDANTVHIVYLKKNKIVSHVSFPQNYPLGETQDITSLQESVITYLKNANVPDADGYYAIQNYPDTKIANDIPDMHKSIAKTLPGYIGGLLITPGFQYGHIQLQENDVVKVEEKQLPLPDAGEEFVPGYDGPYTVLNNHQELIGKPAATKNPSTASVNISQISKKIERSRDTTLLVYSNNGKTVGIQEIPNSLFKQTKKFNDYTKSQMKKYDADEIVAVVDKNKVHGATPSIKRTLKKNKFNLKLAQMDTKTLEAELLDNNILLS
jgi:hypothetical protein